MRNWLWAMGAVAALAATGAQAQRIDGFGSNVPLSFAVRQIVPNDYVVRFEPSVDQSAKVTWSGADEWQSVLTGLARSKGLSYRIQGQNVIVGSGGAAAAAPVQAAAPAPVAAPAYVPPASSGGMRTGGLVVLPTRSAAPPAPAPAPYAAAPQQRVPYASLPPAVGSGISSQPLPDAAPAASAPVEDTKPPVAVTSPSPAPVTNAPVLAVPETAPARDESRMSRRERDRQRAIERAEARAADRASRPAAPVASAVPAVSPRAMQQSGAWRAPRGETLNNVLADWAERAGWSVVVSTRIVYELQAGAEFEGEFTEAAAALLRSVRADPMPHATFYRGNKVLVVSDPTS